MRDQLRALGNRVLLMFARGVLRGVTDTAGRQVVQIELLKGELRSGIERMQNYGFTCHPLGGDVAVAFLGGNREQGIVLAVDDRRYRLSLQPGEVALYDDLGNKVELLRDRMRLTATQQLEVIAPTTHITSALTLDGPLTVNGDVATTGTLKNNGKNVGSALRVSGVTPGSGNSGGPV